MARVKTRPPGAAGSPRRTKVTRRPYYCPWTGEWLYLAADRAHSMMVEDVDEEGNTLASVPLYQHKGYVPLEAAQHNAEWMARLPVNWQDVCHRNAEPVYAEGYTPPDPEDLDKSPEEKARDFWVNRPEPETADAEA